MSKLSKILTKSRQIFEYSVEKCAEPRPKIETGIFLGRKIPISSKKKTRFRRRLSKINVSTSETNTLQHKRIIKKIYTPPTHKKMSKVTLGKRQTANFRPLKPKIIIIKRKQI